MAIDLAMKKQDDELLARIFRSRASLYMNRIENFDDAARLIDFCGILKPTLFSKQSVNC